MKHSYFNVEEGAVINLMEGDKVHLVTSVGVQRRFRGRGAASRLLDEVVADADREGVTLVLAVAPDGTGLERDDLIAFYSRHGFSELDEEDTMIREPKVIA